MTSQQAAARTLDHTYGVQPLQQSQVQGSTPLTNGFTETQLNVLRNQILAFRRIKRGDKVLPPDLLQGIKPPALPPTAARQGLARGLNQPPGLPGSSSAASRYGPQATATQRPFPAGYPAAVGEPQRKSLPISTFTLDANQAAVQQPNTFSPALQYRGLDLLAAEYQALLARGRKRLLERAAEPANDSKRLRLSEEARKRPADSGKLKLEQLCARFLKHQEGLRRAVESEQGDIRNMSDRAYRKFVRDCIRQRLDLIKQEEKTRSEKANERMRLLKNWRVALGERATQLKDLRSSRNRGVVRVHERAVREHNKQKDDDRARRLEALKARDFEAYQEILREQTGPDTAGARYEIITKFLNDTEDYLHRLTGKVASVKLTQEASEAAAVAIAEARAQGLSEEAVQAAATTAAREAALSSDLVRASKEHSGDAQSRYYSLAHSVEEAVTQQPRLLNGPRGAQLREYQLVGLQWMVSLYNNHLNGILADEMGLGKTVQVMALLAYLMERKDNFGPHLIIVPNAVIVNWKSELSQWLPNVRCIYYVGHKEERARKYAAEVQSLQFNVLVTTYEYVMRDRSRLSKVEWKYIIIDEAQRMKDRQSKLSKDLDRFTAARRLLLTGTPLQNELRELWSLLNLLLPEVFDDKTSFTEWFGEGQASGPGVDEWLETEKRVVVIHRLHQILEPFMLRRQVEDVERKLPPKVAIVVKVAMSAFQRACYSWVKATGTIRVNPALQHGAHEHRAFVPLNNKCVELRKVCNHPFLSYPPQFEYDPAETVHHCGKLAVLDRMLIKLHAAGHRVLLFSTMTRLLDLLEVYLRWRRVPGTGAPLGYLRIDGSTSLEDRETAIHRFNEPGSPAFIFLLSIRAAGRGLNLQSADTVVVYDPDPNPKNEEQAIARAHRIGQTKEVLVVHLESVVDVPKQGGASGSEAGAGGLYADSIESLVRNKIQKQKIDLANEVIDAGRFDMRTTMEERKQTLETMLQDEERTRKATNEVPSNAELNRMISRSEAERQLFDRLDVELEWPQLLADDVDVEWWLRYTEEELERVVQENSKSRASRV